MSDDPHTGLELLHRLLTHHIEGLPEGQAPSAEQLLKAAIDVPLSMDDLEEIQEFISEQHHDGVNGVMVFESGAEGPTLGVSAVTHGNEPAGLASLLVLIALQENGLLNAGRVIFTANNLDASEAFFDADTAEERQNARAAKGDINMNRLPDNVMRGDFNAGESYALKRTQSLKRFWHQFDVGVDLHTTSTPAPPMLVAHEIPDERRKYLFANLPATDIITGIYGYLSGNSVTEFFGGNHKPAVTLTMECGQHQDQNSFDVAQNTVVTLLENMQMIPTLDRNFAHDLNELSDISHFSHFDFPDWNKGAFKPKDGAIFHPQHDPNLQLNGLNPSQIEAIEQDTYTLVNKRNIRTHSAGHMVEDPDKTVWRNFEDISQGDVVMRGNNTGFEVCAKKDGQILMAPANPTVEPSQTEAVAFVSAPVKELSLQASPTYKPQTWQVEHVAVDQHLQDMVLSGQLPTEPEPPKTQGMWGSIKTGLSEVRDGVWRIASAPFRAAGMLPKWEYRNINEASISTEAKEPITRKAEPKAPEPMAQSTPSTDMNMANISAQTKGQPPTQPDMHMVDQANTPQKLISITSK